MSSRLNTIFNIRPGEGSIVALLVLFSFGQGLFFSLFTVVSGALFLTNFNASWFPKLYLIQGILGFLFVNAYSRFQRSHSLRITLPATLGLCLITCLFFTLALWISHSDWVGFAMNCLVVPMAAVTNLAFWGIAGRCFDLEQSKRLNALIGSGQSLVSLLGFFSYRLLVGKVTEDAFFILAASLGLAICLAAFPFCARHFRARLSEKTQTPQNRARLNYTSPFFLSMSFMVICGVVMTYLADFAFFGALNREHRGDREAVGAILAVFLGLCRLLELTCSAFGGRFLHAFGLLVSLMLLPCTALAVTLMTLFADASFFPMMGLVQLLVIVLGVSVYGPSSRLLFQPLDEDVRFQAQTQIEGGVSQLGIVLVSLGLILINKLGASVNVVVWLMCAVLAMWLVFTLMAYKQYTVLMMHALGGLKNETNQPGGPTGASLKNTLLNTYFRFKLRLLPGEKRIPLVTRLGEDGLGYEYAMRSGDMQAVELAKQTWEEVSTAKAARTPMQLFAMTGSQDQSIRGEAALFLCFKRDKAYHPALDRLLQDSELRPLALIAAGYQEERDYWPVIVDHLDSPYTATASAVLAHIGAKILKHKELSYLLFFRRPDLLKKIVAICPNLSGPETRGFLLDKLGWPNQEIERMVLMALRGLDVKAGAEELVLVHHRIQVNLLRYTWFLAALRDIPEEAHTEALLESIRQEAEAVFQTILMLLNLICDGPALALIRENLKGEKVRRDYALEIAQEVIPPQLHSIILPVLERGSPHQTLSRMGIRFSQPTMTPNERLAALISRGNSEVGPWMRVLAIGAIEQGGELPDALIVNLFSNIPLVREAAAAAIFKLDPNTFNEYLPRLEPGIAQQLRTMATHFGNSAHHPLSAIEKIRWLERSPLFKPIPHEELARLAVHAEEVRAVTGSVLIQEDQANSDLFLITQGRLSVRRPNASIHFATPPEVIGAANPLFWENAEVTAMGYCRLLRLNPRLFFGD